MTPTMQNAIDHALKAIEAAVMMRPVDAARHVAEALISLVTPDAAKQLIDDAAVRRANAIADEAEASKFGAGDP